MPIEAADFVERAVGIRAEPICAERFIRDRVCQPRRLRFVKLIKSPMGRIWGGVAVTQSLVGGQNYAQGVGKIPARIVGTAFPVMDIERAAGDGQVGIKLLSVSVFQKDALVATGL